MFYNIALYTALIIFGIGLIYKISGWFRFSIGINAKNIKTSTRILTAVKGLLTVILSKKVLILIRVFIIDVLFQIRIFK